MQLNTLQARNYRCFDELEITFHPRLTVIVAENGQGKSSLLDAVRVGLWPFINCFDLARTSYNDPINSIAIADVRLVPDKAGGMARQLPAQVTMGGDWGEGPGKQWMRWRESETSKSQIKEDAHTGAMKAWARRLQADIRDPDAPLIDLPMFGYYGTGRLWSPKKLTESKSREPDTSATTDFYIRTFGYRNCMDTASSYKHFREWFVWAWESRNNMQMQSGASAGEKHMADSRIRMVQEVIDTFLQPATGWHTLEYSFETERSLVLKHDQLGQMRVDHLSDGIRSMLAMAGDIAYRCIKLNPHLGAAAARETGGVVLIDEVDMHLHPRWQQLVLTQLLQAFPKIQFIVTTHSPQVLTTVKPESIRGLRTVGGRIVVREDYPFSEGAEAQQVLQDILGVEARPGELEIVRKLSRYFALVYEDRWDGVEALALRQELNGWSRGNEPALIQADMDIRMRQFRRNKGAA